jgi:hypothetical protein
LTESFGKIVVRLLHVLRRRYGMKTMLRLFALTLALSPSLAFSQTTQDIEAAYGKPLKAYSVSEHILMTPQYAADGLVCVMRLYPRHIGPNANYLSSRLPFEELKAVLNRLVPPGTRGLRSGSFGRTATGGPAAWTTYDYERVTFTFISPFGPLRYDGATLRKGEFVFSAQPDSVKKPEPRAATDDDFASHLSADTEIVEVTWNDRKCTAP